MRHVPNLRIERYRKRHPAYGDSPAGENVGFFVIETPRGIIRIIASDGLDGAEWEHVSVSLMHRCPTWEEMALVKDLFWPEDETVVQFHPRKTEHVNYHRFCLHLWRKHESEPELPPSILVGPKASELLITDY